MYNVSLQKYIYMINFLETFLFLRLRKNHICKPSVEIQEKGNEKQDISI